MKVLLDRPLMLFHHPLHCVVCRSPFFVGELRTLLYNDRGLLQGDICPACLELSPTRIKQKLRQHALVLAQQADSDPELADLLAARTTELLDCATEALKLPSFWQRVWKRIEIFLEATQEQEDNRTGLSSYHKDYRLALERMLRQSGE